MYLTVKITLCHCCLLLLMMLPRSMHIEPRRIYTLAPESTRVLDTPISPGLWRGGFLPRFHVANSQTHTLGERSPLRCQSSFRGIVNSPALQGTFMLQPADVRLSFRATWEILPRSRQGSGPGIITVDFLSLNRVSFWCYSLNWMWLHQEHYARTL
jgi:hypothetical protein